MSAEERGLERGEVEKLLEKSTGKHWYWQPGWGLQYWKDGGLGLLITDGQEGAVTGHDFALIERAQDLAAGWLEQHTRAEAAEKVMDDAIALWVRLGHPMLLAAAQELREARAALASAQEKA